jgi:hypothetical protein
MSLEDIAKVNRPIPKESLYEPVTKGMSWAPVAHTCNPSYSGGRDQENYSSKPTRENSS